MIPSRACRTAAVLATALGLLSAGRAAGQETVNEQLRRVLTDPEAMKELEKTKNLAPVEMFKTQVLPNDVLPFLKPNHWGMLATEMRSNQIDYVGALESSRVPLENMPLEIVYRREARLPKGKRTRITMPVLLPRIPKEIQVGLRRPESIRQDELWTVPLSVLEPHQMLVMVLTRGPNSAYGAFNKMSINAPRSAMVGDSSTLARQRYYRYLLPEDPAQPQLPSHPLAWTMISHVIWDGMPPETLSVAQQEAMLDWLHWGGQLILVGGAGPAFAPLAESFLGPYLPAAPDGDNALLKGEDLGPFSRKFHAAAVFRDPEELLEDTQTYEDVWKKFGRRYDPTSAPLRIDPAKPLYLTGMKPKPGASVVGLGRKDLPPLAVEARVGRGRIVMVGVNIVEPTLLAWPGYETFVRRVLLRRIEDPKVEDLRYGPAGAGYQPPRYDFLTGPDVTWLRYHGRDLGAPTRAVAEDEDAGAGRVAARPANIRGIGYNPIDHYQVPVAEWLDAAALPTLSRKTLEQASGIEIPDSRFVLKVILGYLICLVPLNWLVCRYALGRREWAWLIVPILSVGFAVVVERAAAYDVGYDSTCDEIDVLETHGDYGRGHLSRFASLYTTGRVEYSVSYVEDPTALVLPMSTGRSLRGEDLRRARLQTMPHPELNGYQIQPRSLAMFRAEQMAGVSGAIRLVDKDGRRAVLNANAFTVKDAVLIDMSRGYGVAHRLGDLAPNAAVEVSDEGTPVADFESDARTALGDRGALAPKPFLDMLVTSSQSRRPEEAGEVRVVGWTDKVYPGQTIEPPVDRHRGFTLIVAHVRPAVVPDPDGIDYDALANGPEQLPNQVPQRPQVVNYGFRGPFPGSTPGGAVVKSAPVPNAVRLPPGAMPVPFRKPAASGAPTPDSADDEANAPLEPTEDFSAEKPRR